MVSKPDASQDRDELVMVCAIGEGGGNNRGAKNVNVVT